MSVSYFAYRLWEVPFPGRFSLVRKCVDTANTASAAVIRAAPTPKGTRSFSSDPANPSMKKNETTARISRIFFIYENLNFLDSELYGLVVAFHIDVNGFSFDRAA